MTRPARTTRRFSYSHAAGLALVVVAVAGGLSYAAWSRVYAPSRRASSETLMLMTRPIAVLPPHSHIVNGTQADSILDPSHGIFVNSDIYVAPRDLFITEITPVVENAPPSILHHLLILRLNGRDASCPNRYDELYSTGADTPKDFAASPYAIFLKRGDRLLLSGMVHNPLPPEGEGGVYRDVSIGFKLSIADTENVRMKPIEYHRLIISDTPCANPSPDHEVADTFTVPPHAASYRLESTADGASNPSRFVFPAPGMLVGIGAHMHPIDGGKRIDAYLNGVLIQTYLPSEDPFLPWVRRTNPTLPFAPMHVHAGDVLTFAVTYDNDSSEPLRDAMGQLGLLFSPDPKK